MVWLEKQCAFRVFALVVLERLVRLREHRTLDTRVMKTLKQSSQQPAHRGRYIHITIYFSWYHTSLIHKIQYIIFNLIAYKYSQDVTTSAHSSGLESLFFFFDLAPMNYNTRSITEESLWLLGKILLKQKKSPYRTRYFLPDPFLQLNQEMLRKYQRINLYTGQTICSLLKND